MADWSKLPIELPQLIAGKLPKLSDYFVFGAVCVSWRSSLVQSQDHLHPTFFPQLVIPGETKDSKTRRCLESSPGDDGHFTFNKDIHQLHPMLLPVPHEHYCCGSSLGWLVLVDDSFEMHLFNPLSGVRFDLPSSTTLPPPQPTCADFSKYYVTKAVISSDPTTSTTTTTVLIIHGGCPQRIALCKLGDKVWTPLEPPGSEHRDYMDAIYYKHRFYALSVLGTCDIIDTDGPTVTPLAEDASEERFHEMSYLIESNGHLFMARRRIRWDSEDIETDSDSNDTETTDNDSADNDKLGEDNNNNKEEEDYNNNVDNNEVEDQGNHIEGRSDGDEDHDNNSHNDGEDGKDEDDDVDEDEDEDDEDDHVHEFVSIDVLCEKYAIHCYRTGEFRVYKLKEESDGSNEWRRVEDIGDSAFFVGRNTSFSLSACNYMGGCKPNSIYFTDDHLHAEHIREPIRHDIGVFNLKDKSADSIFWAESNPMRPPPFWFTPTPPS